jgi:hypothetical protein
MDNIPQSIQRGAFSEKLAVQHSFKQDFMNLPEIWTPNSGLKDTLKFLVKARIFVNDSGGIVACLDFLVKPNTF